MAKSLLHILNRTFFALCLIALAARGYYDLNDNKGYVNQNLRLIGEKVLKSKCLNKFRVYSAMFILAENYILTLSAFLSIFGLCFGKYLAFLAVLIDAVLVHNPIFYKEPDISIIFTQYLAILGASLAL